MAANSVYLCLRNKLLRWLLTAVYMCLGNKRCLWLLTAPDQDTAIRVNVSEIDVAPGYLDFGSGERDTAVCRSQLQTAGLSIPFFAAFSGFLHLQYRLHLRRRIFSTHFV